jgi:hypothetical protein
MIAIIDVTCRTGHNVIRRVLIVNEVVFMSKNLTGITEDFFLINGLNQCYRRLFYREIKYLIDDIYHIIA